MEMLLADNVKTLEVLDALKGIIDPDLNEDIVTLGFVQDVAISGGDVKFTIELTTPACPLKAKFKQDAEEAVMKLPWVCSVEAGITSKVSGTPPQIYLPGVKNIIAVASGKGGVGKSTVAVNVALALAKEGAKVGLLDADVYGPSLPILLGVHEMPDVSEGQKLLPIERHGLKLMSLGFLIQADEAVIWRGPMVHSLLTQFLQEVDWGELDYMIVDLPPGTGDAQLTLSQSIPLAGVLVVTTPQAMASSIAGKVVSLFRKMSVPVLGAVENMSYFICDNCGKEHDIFDKGGGEAMCKRLNLSYLGGIPLDPKMREADDAGAPVVISDPDGKVAQEFVSVARNLAQQISIANAARGK
jgi:ATP-binding protein involved in chromosome partitioning